MGQVKKALMEAECNAHLHPVFQAILGNVSRQGETNTVYALYCNGQLDAVYLHQATADYECWLCNAAEQSKIDSIDQYEVKPVVFHTHLE